MTSCKSDSSVSESAREGCRGGAAINTKLVRSLVAICTWGEGGGGC